MNTLKSNRIGSIDLLRGLIMIIMALDHTREYFNADAFIFDPLDLEKTTIPLFFTRWITHLCAPIFVLLAGTSIYLSGQRKTKQQLAVFLMKRGIWLIFLEIIVVNFSWFFDIHFSYILLGVIWTLGVSMICMAGLIFIPKKWLLAIGIIFIITHYKIDRIYLAEGDSSGVFRGLLQNIKVTPPSRFQFLQAYQIIPYIGVMVIGYCLGQLYSKEFNVLKRRRILITLCAISWTLFVVVRITNGYLNFIPRTILPIMTGRVLCFLNFSKYPPSLEYILFTTGFAFIFLALTENISNRMTKIISVFGRVPLFYYILHIYLIHLVALIAVVVCNHPWTDMINLRGWVSQNPNLKGYGFNLGIVYLIWIFIVAALYPLCKIYDRYKSEHKDKWWLSYL
jgi:uncharacterized membrane protein